MYNRELQEKGRFSLQAIFSDCSRLNYQNHEQITGELKLTFEAYLSWKNIFAISIKSKRVSYSFCKLSRASISNQIWDRMDNVKSNIIISCTESVTWLAFRNCVLCVFSVFQHCYREYSYLAFIPSFIRLLLNGHMIYEKCIFSLTECGAVRACVFHITHANILFPFKFW